MSNAQIQSLVETTAQRWGAKYVNRVIVPQINAYGREHGEAAVLDFATVLCLQRPDIDASGCVRDHHGIVFDLGREVFDRRPTASPDREAAVVEADAEATE